MRHYIHHIDRTWRGYVNGRSELLWTISRQTVDAMELHVPAWSLFDRTALQKRFQTRDLFPEVVDWIERQEIWSNIVKTPTLIPSFHTFFEDMKFLRNPAMVMKRLIPPSAKSIRTGMSQIFQQGAPNRGVCWIQTSESTFVEIPGSTDDQFEFGYRQIWLYAWRHRPEEGRK